MLFIIAFMVGTFVQPVILQCTDGQLSQVLPVDICDPKRCSSMSKEAFQDTVKRDMKLYTWTKGDKAMVGYCPVRGELTFVPSAVGTTTNVTITVTGGFGKYCNITASFSRHYTAERDPVSGNYSAFTIKEGNETWQLCYPFHVVNGPFASATCRIYPAPAPGTGFGYIYVFFDPNGDCYQDKMKAFLTKSDVYWEENVLDCSKGRK